MSIQIMTQVWKDASVSGSDLLVLLALADHANDDGLCWPSIPRIAQRARLSERQTQRVIERLEQSGDIEIVSKGNGRGHSTLYRVFQNPKRVTTATQEKPIKGDNGDIKGDKYDIKGDIAMSPDPSIESSLESSGGNPPTPTADPYKVWRINVGKPKPATIEALDHLVMLYGNEIVAEAIKTAENDNQRGGRVTIAFVAAICKRMHEAKKLSEQRKLAVMSPISSAPARVAASPDLEALRAKLLEEMENSSEQPE